MSFHSIKKTTQLVVNGKPVDKLGKKARIRDAGVNINALLSGKLTTEQLKVMRDKAEARSKAAAQAAAAEDAT